jgi:Peptidase family M48
MTPVLAAVVAAGIALPHLLPLRHVPPVTAVVLWLSSLALRALVCVLAAVYLVFFLPGTQLFDELTHWCWHAVAVETGLEGHRVGDLALLVPAIALGLSLVWIGVRTARSARAVRELVERHALGQGPRGSVIVGGPGVAFAVAGITRPCIVVSAGALASLDDDELAAALAHEEAHIARRHRFVTLLAVALHAVGRAVPGGTRALRQLTFHLERDADSWTVRRRHDRVALASVICKAAVAKAPADDTALPGVGRTGVSERVSELLDAEPIRGEPALTAALNGLAIAMVACTLFLAAAVPTAAVAGVEHDAHHGHHGQHCEH